MTRDEIDGLPYGVITLDRLGRILRYNYAEATFSRRTVQGTLGLGFFTDVAPCTNVQAFKGRFDAFARKRDSSVERFDFTFAFRWGSQDVSMTLLRKAERDEINLIVRARTLDSLDIAKATSADTSLPDAASISEQDPGSGLFSVGTQERACTTASAYGQRARVRLACGDSFRRRVRPRDCEGRSDACG